VNLTSGNFCSQVSREQVEQLVESLLREILNNFPLSLDFVGELTDTATLPALVDLRLLLALIVNTLNLCSPRLLFLGLLGSLEVVLEVSFIFLLLDLELVLLSLSLSVLLAFLILLSLLLVFDISKANIFSSFDQLIVGARLDLLLLGTGLFSRVLLSLVSCVSVVHDHSGRELDELAKLFPLVVGFVDATIKLSTKVGLSFRGSKLLECRVSSKR